MGCFVDEMFERTQAGSDDESGESIKEPPGFWVEVIGSGILAYSDAADKHKVVVEDR
jgi:hypothetical protein